MEVVQKLRIACGNCAATNMVPPARLSDRPTCGRCKSLLFDGTPLELTQDRFESVLSNTDVPVLVDFWAPWCGPCRMMAPVYAQAAQRLEPRMRVAKLDTEQAQEISSRLGIRSIPTLILFDHGREVARHSGAMDLGSLLRWIDAHAGSIT